MQRLADGSTLVNYGTSNSSLVLFNIHNPGKKKLFEIEFSDTLRSYRVYHYLKLPKGLTRPTITTVYKDGKMFLVTESGHSSYQWNTGARSHMIEVKETGIYKVWVTTGRGGWLSSREFVVRALVKEPSH